MFNDTALDACVLEIERCGVGTLSSFLKTEVRYAMLRELEEHHLKAEPEEFGPYRVKQAFKSFDSFGDGSLYARARDELEDWLEIEFSIMYPRHLSAPLRFSHLVVQRYEPTRVGISAHRDGKNFINLIAVLILEGKGRFCVCDDREGSNAISVRNEPGDLLLMRGPGFLGSDYQPFHFVDNITERRTTFALRHKRKPKGSSWPDAD